MLAIPFFSEMPHHVQHFNGNNVLKQVNQSVFDLLQYQWSEYTGGSRSICIDDLMKLMNIVLDFIEPGLAEQHATPGVKLDVKGMLQSPVPSCRLASVSQRLCHWCRSDNGSVPWQTGTSSRASFASMAWSRSLLLTAVFDDEPTVPGGVQHSVARTGQHNDSLRLYLGSSPGQSRISSRTPVSFTAWSCPLLLATVFVMRLQH
jgi:hypothetical protein